MGTPANGTALNTASKRSWLVLPVCWGIVVFAFDFNGLYGQDAYEYHRYASRIHQWLTEGRDAGNYFWPVLYPLLAGFASFLMPTALALQFINLLSIGVTTWVTCRIIQLIHPQAKPYHYLLVSLIVCPYLLQSSVLVMSDALATCLTISALYCYSCYVKRHRVGYFMLAITLSGLAFQTRYACAVLLFPIAIYTLFLLFKRKHALWLIPAALVLILSMLPDQLIRPTNTFPFQFETVTTNWSLTNLFTSTFHTKDGILSYTSLNILYVLALFYHPAYFVLFFPLLFFYKKLKPISTLQQLLWATVLFYLIFIGGINSQNLRFLLISFPLVIVLFYPAWEAAFTKHKAQMQLLTTLVFLIQIGLFCKVLYPIWKLNNLEKNIANTLKTHPAQTVYTFEMNGALETYLPEKNCISLWEKPISTFRSGELVLFNVSKFTSQWQGKQPMLNWVYLNKHYQIDTLYSFENDWKLYEIK